MKIEHTFTLPDNCRVLKTKTIGDGTDNVSIEVYMKKSYKLSNDVNALIHVVDKTIDNDKLIVKVQTEPIDGDILISSSGNPFIYNGLCTVNSYGAYIGINACNELKNVIGADLSTWTSKKDCRYATEPERKDFLKRIETELGKRWNINTKRLEYFSFIPKKGEKYWFVNLYGGIYRKNNISNADKYRIEHGNSFKTKDEAEIYANKLKTLFMD